MRVIFAAAGSGGHVNPAIAIANMIKKEYVDSEILFIGTKTGLENKLVQNAGYKIKHISTGKLIRSITLKNVKAVLDTYKGISDAKKILKEFKPDLVIGTGGYICGPVMWAAKSLKIKYMLHESNAFPGVAVKLLAKNASKVMLGLDDAKKRLKRKDNLVYTGTPAKFNKADFEKLDTVTCKKELNLENIDKKIILVTCGSQGARKINEVVIDMVKKYQSDKYFVILVTGDNTYSEIKEKLDQIQKEINKDLSKYIRLEKFVFNMDKMYKSVDMCITRAGAMTITELTITKKPAILIPLPTSAENHQYYNAKVFDDINAGILIEQKDLTEEIMNENINKIINNNVIDIMSENTEKLVIQNVEKNILDAVKDVMKEKV